MKRVFVIGVLACCAVVAWAGKGGGGKPPKDPPPPSDPAIAYAEIGRFQVRHLMVVDADGSAPRSVAEGDSLLGISWSHDSSRLCYHRTIEDLAAGRWGIYTVNVDGTGEALVYEFPDNEAPWPLSGNPDWSPAPAEGVIPSSPSGCWTTPHPGVCRRRSSPPRWCDEHPEGKKLPALEVLEARA